MAPHCSRRCGVWWRASTKSRGGRAEHADPPAETTPSRADPGADSAPPAGGGGGWAGRSPQAATPTAGFASEQAHPSGL